MQRLTNYRIKKAAKYRDRLQDDLQRLRAAHAETSRLYNNMVSLGTPGMMQAKQALDDGQAKIDEFAALLIESQNIIRDASNPGRGI